MGLTTEMIMIGIFNLLLVLVFIIVALIIMLKYWKAKDKTFLLTGIAWFGISEPWWPATVSFLIALFTGKGLSIHAYLIINAAFLPIFLTFWLWVMLHLMGIKKKVILIIIHLLISLILELLFFYFLFTDVSMLGTTTKMSPVDIDFGPIAQVFLAYILTVFLISGFSFAIKTLKIDEPRPKLRGKFLLLAFLLYLIGAILELIIYSIINKLIILSSAIVFYIAFVMPEKIERLFLKK
ncbi:MAG: hypothetical protein EU529_08215 [Promethearchaeota archaeon]|nr:MAG: hypothetical protein EU529_08215 [Candidatus Lokiarchaeota archaeon]